MPIENTPRASRRLFFALYPEAALRRRLRELALAFPEPRLGAPPSRLPVSAGSRLPQGRQDAGAPSGSRLPQGRQDAGAPSGSRLPQGRQDAGAPSGSRLPQGRQDAGGASSRDCASISSQAKLMREENIHLTLAFLGEQAAEKLPCIVQAADKIAGEAFDLSLDQVGFWLRPQVFWIGATRMPPALLELVAALGRNLAACDIELDRRPFQAHLTLARKCRHGPLRPLPVAAENWRVEAFVLMESFRGTAGSTYRVVRSWPLRRP